jgi:hypothetical protein
VSRVSLLKISTGLREAGDFHEPAAVNAAQAGPLLERLKNTVKNEAKLVKPIVKTEVGIARCVAKAATKKPCII